MADTPKQDATAEPAPNGSAPELGAAAEALQVSRAESTPGATSTGDAAVPDGGAKDVAMTDAPGDQAAASPALAQPAATSTSTPTPVPPPRTSTPMRQGAAVASGANGDGSSSRAASAHPDAGGAVATTMPAEAAHHGAPVRTYLNTKVTGALLEGMKQLAKDQPKDPLRVLGEFLLERSKELEGAN